MGVQCALGIFSLSLYTLGHNVPPPAMPFVATFYGAMLGSSNMLSGQTAAEMVGMALYPKAHGYAFGFLGGSYTPLTHQLIDA